MALTTATAVALSLRQGYIVAIVGLLGGFVTPALAGSAASDSWVLFAYLLLLELGLVFVARKRSWGAPAAAHPAGRPACGSSRGWAARPAAGDSLFIGLFLVATTGLFLVGLAGLGAALTARLPDGQVPTGQLPYLAALRWVALAGALFAMAGLLANRDYGALEWAFLGLIAGGAFVLARLDEEYHGLAWLASGAITFLLFLFAGQLAQHPERAGDFLVTHLIFGLLIVGGRLRGPLRQPPCRPLRVAGVAGRPGLPAHAVFLRRPSWAPTGSPGAPSRSAWPVLFTAFALAGRRSAGGATPNAEAPLAAFAVGATCFLSLALPLELEREWLTVSWALEVWALLWLAEKIKVKELRIFAELLSVLVAVRLLFNPEVLSYPIGTTPIFNWLLYGYGVPLAAFVMRRAWRAARTPGRGSTEGLEWLAQAFAFALVSLEIRHFFYRDAGNLRAAGERRHRHPPGRMGHLRRVLAAAGFRPAVGRRPAQPRPGQPAAALGRAPRLTSGSPRSPCSSPRWCSTRCGTPNTWARPRSSTGCCGSTGCRRSCVCCWPPASTGAATCGWRGPATSRGALRDFPADHPRGAPVLPGQPARLGRAHPGRELRLLLRLDRARLRAWR